MFHGYGAQRIKNMHGNENRNGSNNRSTFENYCVADASKIAYSKQRARQSKNWLYYFVTPPTLLSQFFDCSGGVSFNSFEFVGCERRAA